MVICLAKEFAVFKKTLMKRRGAAGIASAFSQKGIGIIVVIYWNLMYHKSLVRANSDTLHGFDPRMFAFVVHTDFQ